MFEFAIFVIVMIVISIIGKAKQQSAKSGGTNPRVQKLIEQLQGQSVGQQPTQPQGQFTRPTAPGQYSAPTPYPAPTQYQQPIQHQPPAQHQPHYQPQFQPQAQYQPPAQWLPSYGPPEGHRPPQHQLPTPRQDTDGRVRELMESGNEVAAIRLLCDEQDMGILEAQEHARTLVAPQAAQSPGTQPRSPQASLTPEAETAEEEPETRYVGSAAFAESIFDLDREQDTWASGWVDTPEPEDRSDIDELWQTVRNPPRPGTTPQQ